MASNKAPTPASIDAMRTARDGAFASVQPGAGTSPVSDSEPATRYLRDTCAVYGVVPITSDPVVDAAQQQPSTIA